MTSGKDLLFYDGDCGLCHRAVQFAARHDPEGSRFQYAPLGGATFASTLSESARLGLPDSVVIRTSDGRILTRSDAVLHLAERAGGIWKSLGGIAILLPRWLLDAAYDGVARVRKHIFSKPKDACPLLPAELQGRFLP